MALAVVLFASSAVSAESLPQLASPKNAVACQKALLGASRTYFAAKLKALDKCAGATFKCIQLKGSAPKCLAQARRVCDPTALTQIQKAEDALIAKLAKACGDPKVPFADLASALGLGYSEREAECTEILSGTACESSTDPACTNATDFVGILDCVAFAYGRAAETLLGAGQARAREMIALAELETDRFLDIPDHGGTGASTTGSIEDAKRVTACTAAIAKAGAKFAQAISKALGTCITSVVACTSTAPEKQGGCIEAASRLCRDPSKGVAAKVAAARAALTSAIEKKCGEETLSYATLRGAGAANLDATLCECESVGEGIDDLAAFDRCLVRQHECQLARLAPITAPRVDDLLALAGLDLRRDLLCIAPVGLAARASTSFGRTIERFVRGVSRVAGPVSGILKTGRPPLARVGAPRTIKGVRYVSGRSRVARGASTTLRVRFGDLTKSPSAALASDPGKDAALEPLALIAAVRRADGTFVDGYMQVPLGGAAEDDVEVQFSTELPSCAFELALATVASDGEIGEYVGMPVVPDLNAPAVTTPTPTITPIPTVTPTLTATPMATPTHTAVLRLFNVDDVLVARLNGVGYQASKGEDKTFDASASLQCGDNLLQLSVLNLAESRYSYGAQLTVDGVTSPRAVDTTCGSAAVGCNGGDTTSGFVADEFDYFCLDCGSGCVQGTCTDPHPAPASGSYARVRARLSGASTRTSRCGPSTGPDKVFAWKPLVTGCYEVRACGASSTSSLALEVRGNGCNAGTPACGEPILCGSNNGASLLGNFDAGKTYFVAVDLGAAETRPITLEFVREPCPPPPPPP